MSSTSGPPTAGRPTDPPTAGPRTGPPTAGLGGNVRWSLAAIWQTRRRLSYGLALLVLARGLPPAALALAAKGLIDAAAGGPERASLAPWLALAFASMLAEALAPIGQRYFASRLQDEINLRYAVAVLEQAGRIEPSRFEDGGARELFERAREAATTALAGFLQDLLSVSSGIIQAVTLVAVIAWIEPLVLLALPPVSIPYLFIQYRLARGRYGEERSRLARRRHTRHLADQLTGESSLAEVRLLGLPPLLVRRYRELLEGFMDADRGHQRRGFAAATLFGTVSTLVFFTLFARLALRAAAGVATLGELAVFGGAAGRLRASIEVAISGASGAFERLHYIADLRAFLALEPASTGTNGADEDASSRAVERVELRGVRYTYPGAERPALDGVSFDLRRGEIVALVGENGAGKSTVARLLAGVLTPSAGVVRLDGRELAELGVDALARRVSLLPQAPARFEATAEENVAFGDWRRLLGRGDEVAAIARRAGAEELLRSLPAGGATRLGRIGGEHELSGGQWQLLGLARAIAHGGGVLILDEPSSSLDPRAERELLGRLRELGRERATLLITHRPTAVALADRVVVLDAGRVVEHGTHAELVARGGLYAQLFALGERAPAGAPPA